ncbi:hypothetical protein ES707_22275 [subsurface metagenome]
MRRSSSSATARLLSFPRSSRDYSAAHRNLVTAKRWLQEKVPYHQIPAILVMPRPLYCIL